MSDRLASPPLPRRDFLGLSGTWAAALAVFGSLLGMARLARPSVLPEAGNRFRVGRPEDYARVTVRVIPERQVQVVATERGFAALSLICTHLGCIVKKTEAGFACPCHGSEFDAHGVVTGGPAPRGLRWLEVSTAPDGNLVVDAKKEVPAGTYYVA